MRLRNTKGKRSRKQLSEWSASKEPKKGILRPKMSDIKRKRQSDREFRLLKTTNSLGLLQYKIHLIDIFPLFRVEIYGSDHMLQFTERCFNFPSEPIEAFDLSSRKGRIREIRNDILVGVIRNFKAKDPKRNRIFIP